jgi:hypothetical protein
MADQDRGKWPFEIRSEVRKFLVNPTDSPKVQSLDHVLQKFKMAYALLPSKCLKGLSSPAQPNEPRHPVYVVKRR